MPKKILVFGDTHLTPRFNSRKYQFLEKIISEADQVIILGDFWESYASTFDQFINSSWQKLFPLLKSKNAIYIYGNHDREKSGNGESDQFSTMQLDNYDLESGGKKFHFEHGHRIVPLPDPPLPRPLLKIIPSIESRGLWRRKKPFSLWYKYYNQRMKWWRTKYLDADTILICGHSHLAEINLERHFANPGPIKWGVGCYLTIIDGEMTLHMSNY